MTISPIRGMAAIAGVLMLTLCATAHAASYQMRAEIPGMRAPKPLEPVYNKPIDPSAYTGTWSTSAQIMYTDSIAGSATRWRYAIFELGFNETQQLGRQNGTPCPNPGQYRRWFNANLGSPSSRIDIYHQLCRPAGSYANPSSSSDRLEIDPVRWSELAGLLTPGKWGTSVLKGRYGHFDHSGQLYAMLVMGVEPNGSKNAFATGSPCNAVGEYHDHVGKWEHSSNSSIGGTGYWFEVNTQLCLPANHPNTITPPVDFTEDLNYWPKIKP